MLNGLHTFPLDCHYISRDYPALKMTIEVQADLEVSWNDGVCLDKAKPTLYAISVGGVGGPELPFSEAYGELKAFILAQVETLDNVEAWGVNKLEAMEAIQDAADWDAHHDEMRMAR